MQLKISNREEEVLRKMCQGLTSREIGTELFISPLTVEAHKRNLFVKLDARNSVHLAYKAETLGLIRELA